MAGNSAKDVETYYRSWLWVNHLDHLPPERLIDARKQYIAGFHDGQIRVVKAPGYIETTAYEAGYEQGRSH
jgi:hypothetical protein